MTVKIDLPSKDFSTAINKSALTYLAPSISILRTPIIGDAKYAVVNADPDQRVDLHDGLLADVADRMCLHARSLTIPRHGRKPLTVTAPLPKHMKDAFDDLGFSEGDAKE